MERVQQYLDVVPLPVLIVLPLLAAGLFLIVPGRWRLSVALILMVPWLVLGRLSEIGVIAPVAKATGVVGLGLVAFAAWLDPGPRRRLPALAWVYLVMGLLAFIYILTVRDRTLAIVIRIQWFVLVIAALAVARTLTDEASVVRVVRSLAIGFFIGTFVALSDLVLHPNEAFSMGLGRFFPYGANANQIGIVFAVSVPLALYFALRTRNILIRLPLLGVCGIAAGLGLLTASRSTMAVMIGASLPLVWALTRRPVIVVIGAVILFAALNWVMGMGEDVKLERLGSLQTGRYQTAVEYLGYISERPLFGLLGTDGQSFLAEDSPGRHPHNAYIEVLYLGGLSYSIPLLILVGVSLRATFVVWRRRQWSGADPLLISMLAGLMVMVYAQGFINGLMYYPTYAWAFLHVMLSLFFLGLAGDLKSGRANMLAAEVGEEDWSDADDEDEPETDAASEQVYEDLTAG